MKPSPSNGISTTDGKEAMAYIVKFISVNLLLWQEGSKQKGIISK